jgi:hypothetical protein
MFFINLLKYFVFEKNVCFKQFYSISVLTLASHDFYENSFTQKAPTDVTNLKATDVEDTAPV